MWTFSEMYLEEKVLYSDDTLKIVDTLHSRERKRRDNNQWRPVTDKEILKTIRKALPTLQTEYSEDRIPSNKKVWIYDRKSRINLVIVYDVVQQTGRQKITILTVMRHNKFGHSENTTKKIEL